MKSKNKQKKNLLAVIGLAVFLGIVYYFIGSGLGILVSCENQEIFDITRNPPQQLSVVGPTEISCLIDIEVKLGEEIICNKSKQESYNEKMVISCGDLKKFKGEQELEVNAIFYDEEGKKLGEDSKLGKDLWH